MVTVFENSSKRTKTIKCYYEQVTSKNPEKKNRNHFMSYMTLNLRMLNETTYHLYYYKNFSTFNMKMIKTND